MNSRVYRFNWAVLFLIVLALGCQKTEEKDPCADLMSEGPLSQIGVILVDKETGEQLITTNDPETLNISVTEAHTGEPYKYWDIIYHPENPTALNGVVRLSGIPKTEGDHSYRIQSDDFGSVTLSYTVVKGAYISDSPCSRRLPPPYGITDLRIDNHPFDVFEFEDGTVMHNVVVVKL